MTKKTEKKQEEAKSTKKSDKLDFAYFLHHYKLFND